MRRKAQTGWFFPVNTTLGSPPDSRGVAAPKVQSRWFFAPLAQVVSAGRGTTGH